MGIVVNQAKDTFHLYNEEISYIIGILPNRQLGQLYFGKRIHIQEDYSYFLEMPVRPMSSCVFDTDKKFSMEYIRQEYPVFGTTDYRMPAVEVLQENGSRISDWVPDRGRQTETSGTPGYLCGGRERSADADHGIGRQCERNVSGIALHYFFQGWNHRSKCEVRKQRRTGSASDFGNEP